MKPIIALVLCAAFTSSTTAEIYDWPQWLGPQRNGLTEETGLLKTWPEGGPKLVWKSEKAGLGYSGPAIVDGKLYIMGARDNNEFLLAFDANTGDELWAAPIGKQYQNGWGDGPRGTPTIDGDLVYALGAQGALVCVDAKSGKEKWRTTMQDLGGGVPNWGYCESPLIDGDVILVTPGGSKGAVAALDKLTGSVRWQSTEVPDGAHYSSIVKTNIHGAPQYVQLMEKRLIGLSPSDGQLLWEFPWPGRTAVIPTPIVVGNSIYATSGYGVGCQLVEISADNSVTPKYSDRDAKLMKNHHGGVVKVGDHVYGHSDGVGWVCQDFETGKQVWKDRDALEKGAIGYADGMLYCLGEDTGEVVLIKASPEGWEEAGRFTLTPQTEQRAPRGKIWTHPVIVNGKLYLRDQEILFCFDVKE